MPARGTATNRGLAVDRALASGRGTASGRFNVDGSGGGGGGGDDMTFLDSIALDSVQTFSAISGAYRHLEIYYVARSDNVAAQGLLMRFNGDTGANYDYEITQAQDGSFNAIAAGVAQTSIQIGRLNPSGAPAGSMASGRIWIPYYSTTAQDKGALGMVHCIDAAASTFILLNAGGTWRTANAAITSITFIGGSGAFAANSVASLYGIT